MVKEIKKRVEYYFDSYPTEEDLMGKGPLHAALVHYLVEVLSWLFRGQVCAICEDRNFYQTADEDEYPTAPDVAVIKGVPLQEEEEISWVIGETGPAPHVAIEIASKKTWRIDLKKKPETYASMGVEEYYLYDPNTPLLWRNRYPRLLGWHLEKANGQMVQLRTDPQGRLWSPHLESWLVPDGKDLRLYDRNNQRRLTEAEAAMRRAEVEAEARQAAMRRAEALAEKLRALGVNPDEI